MGGDRSSRDWRPECTAKRCLNAVIMAGSHGSADVVTTSVASIKPASQAVLRSISRKADPPIIAALHGLRFGGRTIKGKFCNQGSSKEPLRAMNSAGVDVFMLDGRSHAPKRADDITNETPKPA